jgi:hypothetical protein
MLSAILFPNDVAIKSAENNLCKSFSALVAKNVDEIEHWPLSQTFL